MNPIVQVEGLRKTYGATVAVDDVSFEVKEGEIFGMVGPNGAGRPPSSSAWKACASRDAGSVRVWASIRRLTSGLAHARRNTAAAIEPAGSYEGLGGARPVRLVLPQSGRLEGAIGAARSGREAQRALLETLRRAEQRLFIALALLPDRSWSSWMS